MGAGATRRYAEQPQDSNHTLIPIRTNTPTRFISAVASLLILAGLLAFTAPANALSPEEDDFIELINQERAEVGLNPVLEYWDLTDDARYWSDEMAAAGSISHNPNLANITTAWVRIAENVGVGQTVASLHNAFMDSASHRANILNPAWDFLGVGVTHPTGGSLWVTVDFMDSGGSPPKVDPSAPPIDVERAAGRDRYATAADISSTMFPGADTVYVATGQNFPDALAAGPAAGHEGAPVLYVRKDSIPGATINELARLSPNKIVVTGGTAVISASVVNQLGDYAATVVRRSGANRYGTAAEISSSVFRSGADTVYIASGATYPDALVAGPAAIADQAPLLLVKRDTIPSPTRIELARLDPSTIVIVGGTSNVSSAVANDLGKYANTVTRVSGSDRWATGKAVSASAFTPGSSDIAYIAFGYGWPDSVAGTAAAARVPGPILLLKTYSIPSATRQELARLDPERIMVFGGTAVVAESVVATLNDYIK